MKNMRLKDIAVPALSLFVICLIVTALLAGTNLLTKDTIEQQSLAQEEASRRVVLSTAESFEKQTVNGSDYYLGHDTSGQLAGYVFTTEAKGYGGTIKVMTGITADGKVSGVVILSQNETPGLGANATKDSYRDQYKQDVPAGGFSVVKGAASANGEIAAMTGATISSDAVTSAVNDAVTLYQQIKGGE